MPIAWTWSAHAPALKALDEPAPDAGRPDHDGLTQPKEHAMGTMISSGIDVVSFLKQQHEEIKQLFRRVHDASGKPREEAFISLRRLLAVHETAEEGIVHPAARRALPNGSVVVDARLQEENEAKKVLAKLESMNVDSTEFINQFTLLERSVLAHAKAEETEEFSQLGNALDQSQLERMRKAAEFAEKMAPTRPHPGIESATANMLAGPFASMLDRARDAFAARS
jgi:hemerythrin superfamily protein